jgi:DNA-binding NtrC family response regulator
MRDPNDEPCAAEDDDVPGSVQVPALVATVTRPGAPAVDARLDLRPLVVGTASDCDLVVDDPLVSARHCELSLTREGVVLRDLGSKSGTLLAGGVSVREVVLPAGVPVTLGASELVLRQAGAPSLIPVSAEGRFGDAVGQSLPMRALFATLERVAPTDRTVLLLGESGTGKEVLARSLHARSLRRDGPFVVFDCGATTPSLVEAELFGHVKGAFTGAAVARSGLLEEADGGTLFIDEIGELPLDLQPKLLRAIEDRRSRRIGSVEWTSFDARIVAATHRDLRAKIADGTFREDLYYRLAVVEVRVPPLRERKEDIPLLVERFLAAHRPPRSLSDLPPHALELLMRHAWPGNVRELRNVVERLLLFPELGDAVIAPLLSAAAPALPAAGADPAAAQTPEALVEMVKELERTTAPLLHLGYLAARDAVLEMFDRTFISMALREWHDNVSDAAGAMGLSRSQLYRILDRLGMRPK